MKKIALFLPLMFVACSMNFKKECESIYVPVKCDIPKREKPKRQPNQDFTDFQVELRTYYEMIEKDLEFCRKEK